VTTTQTFVARAALSIFAGATSLYLVPTPRLRALRRQTFDRAVTLAFAASRLGLYCLLFVVLRLTPRGDIDIYFDEADHAFHGQLPYRDFLSSYAPLHSFLHAFVLHIWYSHLPIMLLSVCAEILLIPIWLRFARGFFSEFEVRSAALLYLTSAISLQFVAVDGQDNVIVALLITLSMILMQRYRAFLAGALMGASVVAFKVLPLIYFPAFFLALKRRWRWAIGAIAVIAVGYLPFALIHLPLLQPLELEGSVRSPGCIPFIFETLTGLTLPSAVWDSLLILCLAAVYGVIAHSCRNASPEARLRVLTLGLAAITLTVVLVSKKSWPPYLMLALFPICLLIPTQRRFATLSFAILGVVTALEHSSWSLLLMAPPAVYHIGVRLHLAAFVASFALQLMLVTAYAWLLYAAIRKMLQTSTPIETDTLTPAT
jgi:hypothetical protein